MTSFVADVGNTRIKWGQCGPAGIERWVALTDDPDQWRRALAEWHVPDVASWVIAGVHPQRRDRLAAWLVQNGHQVRVLDRNSQVPLELKIDAPEKAGIDRLLNVLAARARVPARTSAIVVDAGSAVTVNLLDETGAFAGGAIFPGLRLMAEALHDYTALLPVVKVTDYPPIVPAKSTDPAIAAGIYWAVVGGVAALIRELHSSAPGVEPLPVFLTGGDAATIAGDLPDREMFRYEVVPTLTLEGIRLAVDG